MRAMILAAGRGERMRPLTDRHPKPLLKAGGKSLIVYIIEGLKKANITELVINHAHLGHQIVEALGDGSQLEVKITYSAEQTALETAGGIIQALPLLGKEPFLVVNGDIWTDFDFSTLALPAGSLAHLVVVPNPLHNPTGDFMLAQDGLMRATGVQKLTFSGIGIYSPALFAGMAPERAALAPLLRDFMDQGKVTGQKFTGKWEDIGSPERLMRLDAKLRG
ncbi:MAG: nucleotidyltransferase family protein [Gammaproteobacteria bacterium]|nr:nucleotidyltransferase family protein [Gammaproteobacteria bacterium]